MRAEADDERTLKRTRLGDVEGYQNSKTMFCSRHDKRRTCPDPESGQAI